ncbi:puromycin-sensitive aminopeptidase isoform X2 [Tanacetum coccineum]
MLQATCCFPSVRCANPISKYKHYHSPQVSIDSLPSQVDLSFSLGEEKTIVSAKICVVPRVNGAAAPLVLDGTDLKLISVAIDGNHVLIRY